VDATVIINLIKAGHLELLSALEGWRFSVPDQVAEEVSDPEQAAALARAFEAGHLRRDSSTDPEEIAAYADLKRRMGKGEAACLAIAVTRGWTLASDDRGRAFRRLLRERIGEGGVIDTPEIARIAQSHGLISAEEADRIRAIARE
jgi:predicted nucleic acid-binding protein